MKLIKYEPFFNDPWTDLDRLFERTLPELYQWNPYRFDRSVRSLPLDVYDTDEKRIVQIEVPGVNKKDIELELENAVLSVKAIRHEQNEDSASQQTLTRTVSVGDDIDPDKIQASLRDGILTIELAKREQSKPRQISIS